MLTTRLSILAATLTLLSSGAIAAELPKETAPVKVAPQVGGKPTVGNGVPFDLFQMIDHDKDGTLTIQEFSDNSLSYFDMIDTNKDGELTLDEVRHRAVEVVEKKAPRITNDKTKMAQMVEKRANGHFTAIDTNKDGKVTRSEYLERADQRFKSMDADHDGKVTVKEYNDPRKYGDLPAPVKAVKPDTRVYVPMPKGMKLNIAPAKSDASPAPAAATPPKK